MAATDSQLVDAARDSLKRILDSDAAELSENDRRMRHLEIDRLSTLIQDFERRSSSANRRICQPVVRVNV